MISIFNPYVLLGALITGIGLFGSGFYVGSDYTTKSIAAGQKKSLDVAIVKHEEVAKNDLTSAIKVQTKVQKFQRVFIGIDQEKSALAGSRLDCPIDLPTYGLLNRATSGVFE